VRTLCRFLCAVMVTLSLWSEPALPQTEHVDPAATAEANALIRDMASASDPARWVEAHKAHFTPALADAADRLALDAQSANRLDVALAASTLASVVHGHLGQQERAIRSTLTSLQVRFQRADTVQQYTEVRDGAKRLQDRAAGLALMDLAFRCALLAADAAYFRSSALDAPDAEKDNQLAALEDLLVAFPLQRHTTQRAWVGRLASLTSATVSTALERYFLNQDKIQAVLKRLAPLVEQSIPADFNYGEPTVGNLRKAINTASALAALSYKYGNVAIASSRLAIAEERANELGDNDLVIALISSRYAGERDTRAAPAQLSRLRAEAWQRAQELRNAYRSATGRIWAAYRSDALFGAMLKGELEGRTAAPAEVFARVESLKARMLLERLSTPGSPELRTAQALALENKVLSFKKPSRIDASLTAAEMRLVSQLSGFETIGGGGDDDSRSQALRTLEDLYRGAGAGYRTTASTATLAALQRTLAPDEALIEYVIPPDRLHPALDLWMLLITRNGVQAAHVALDKALGGPDSFTGRISVDGEAPVDSSALGNLIITTRTDIRSADDKAARHRLAALYQLLIGPLAAQGFRPEAFKRLVIVPHGSLHYVPFGALLDAEGRFLIAMTEIVVAPSASTWQLLSQRQRKAGPLVAFANPDLGSRGVPDLPFADQEGAAIVNPMPPGSARLFRAADATRKNLSAEAPRAGILHLATHGEFPDENAANAHALWLADEAGESVALSASDVRGLSMPAARLVVLSVRQEITPHSPLGRGWMV